MEEVILVNEKHETIRTMEKLIDKVSLENK